MLDKETPKIISFPIEEYINTYKKEPESFEIKNVFAQALGCFCFCFAASLFLKDTEITPCFDKPECDFIYKLSDFEINYINKLSLVRKNKLLSSKNYELNVERENQISAKAFISIDFINDKSIKLKIKIDFEKFNIPLPELFKVLFESICLELFPQINRKQKPYTQKTINYIPSYMKFATAPFIHELRRLMTSEKTGFCSENIIAEKTTNNGHYIFKHNLENEINSQILNKLKKMNDLTVDVLNGVIHILLEKSKSPEMEVLLCADDLLFIRGKKASKNDRGIRGGYKDSQRKEIIEHLELLANLKIDISNAYISVVDGNGKRNYQIYKGESSIIHLKKSEKSDYYFQVKPGEALALTLAGAGTKTGLIHKKVAEYDHYRNFWEKRIGNYLAWLWRNRQNKADFLVPLTVETLLSQIRKGLDTNRPQSIRNRLEDALYKLENDLVIKNWQYVDIDENLLSGKKWLEIWLKLKIIIEPPVEILEEYSKIKKIGNKKTNNIDSYEIIKIIKEKNLSQISMAEEMGIRQDILSRIICGKASPSQSEKRKLQNWLLKQNPA